MFRLFAIAEGRSDGMLLRWVKFRLMSTWQYFLGEDWDTAAAFQYAVARQ
jgi:hypothetical protein